jgi:pyruvate dehydrogenase E1 component alpha subunit/2-oxoisovalerate dehydrogenase E1 component alpha subunit
MPQAVGLAWAAKTHRDDAAALVFLDGSAFGSADFHTGMNFAGVFKAPCVFLCRSPAPGGSPAAALVPRGFAPMDSRQVLERGVAYGVRSVRVDGSDPLAVLWVVREALAESATRGPSLIEAVLPSKQAEDASDPVLRLRRHLQGRGLWDEERETAHRAQVDVTLERAIAEEEGVAPPDRDTLFDDVFSTLPWHLREQRAPWARSGGPDPSARSAGTDPSARSAGTDKDGRESR